MSSTMRTRLWSFVYPALLGMLIGWRFVTKRHRAAGFGIAVACLAATAQATPVHYSESVSGDLAQAPSTNLQFDIGNNTISGETSFLSFIDPVPNCHFCVDPDS